MDHRPVISFRTDPNLHLKLEAVRATFPNQRWSEVAGWLFSQPEVVELMRKRVQDARG